MGLCMKASEVVNKMVEGLEVMYAIATTINPAKECLKLPKEPGDNIIRFECKKQSQTQVDVLLDRQFPEY